MEVFFVYFYFTGYAIMILEFSRQNIHFLTISTTIWLCQKISQWRPIQKVIFTICFLAPPRRKNANQPNQFGFGAKIQIMTS
jgi:hypothetical protein